MLTRPKPVSRRSLPVVKRYIRIYKGSLKRKNFYGFELYDRYGNLRAWGRDN